jgi:cell division protein FtsB
VSPELIVSIVLASVAAIPGILAYIGQRGKLQMDKSQQVQEAALKLLEPYQHRVKELEECLASMEEELKELREIVMRIEPVIDGAWRLNLQVKSLRGDPVYAPPDRREFELKPKRVGIASQAESTQHSSQ